MIICVPTPLSDSREPDLTYLVDSADGAGRRCCARASWSCSSRPPTRAPPASACCRSSRSSGLTAGSDFHLAFSPERIDPGRTDYTVRTTPKLVGGITAACDRARAGALRARSATRSIVLSSPEAAELSKLLENIFRSVNIALVNELAQLCDRLGIDVWEVIDAASTKPFGFMRFDPGPGMGGHCLPVDPFYLAFKARQHDFYPEFIELAGKVNQAQPGFCVERIERALNGVRKPVNGSRVLVLGVSYKGGVGDIRESPALKIIGRLQDLGAEVSYHDPYVPELPRTRARLGRARRGAGASADLAAIVTAHPERRLRGGGRGGAAGRSTSAASPAGSRRRTWSGSDLDAEPAAAVSSDLDPTASRAYFSPRGRRRNPRIRDHLRKDRQPVNCNWRGRACLPHPGTACLALPHPTRRAGVRSRHRPSPSRAPSGLGSGLGSSCLVHVIDETRACMPSCRLSSGRSRWSSCPLA